MGETRRGVVRFDGGSSGNPGPAASAFVIEVDGMVVLEEGRFIGRATNNEAEYDGLIRGLERALDLHITDLVVLGDSELVIRQMKGDYKVRKPHLKPLYEKARELAARFSKVDFRHVPREQNKGADKLLRKALKEKRDVME